MLVSLKISKTVHWVLRLFFILFLIFTLFRIATYIAFHPLHFTWADLMPSFLMGVRYDLRWISIILLPIIVISLDQKFSPFYSERNKKWWTWYLSIITFLVFFFFAADFGNFSYNHTRIDAGALNFIEDAGISLAMLFQTYPMILLIGGLVTAVLIFRWMYYQTHWKVVARTDGKLIPYRRVDFIITSLLFVMLIYGKFAPQPLTREDSFAFNNNFKSYLALNPLQNFFTTLRFRQPEFNEQKAMEAYPIMAEWMGLPPGNYFNYRRQILPGSHSLESKPNIILIQCESFSMYKSSISGNPLLTTPFFDSLAGEGVFFERCFTPHFSTARGLFATLTGIPDVQQFKFSTRNPLALQQHTIINNFEDYSKFYFLGGSPEFNNFNALLQNIEGLKQYTELNLKSPKINVWGVSDHDLFKEANEVFREERKPFFAYIQTSDNHRPYMIPSSDSDFVRMIVQEDTLKKYGFESLDEFNSFRYSDYCFRKFMEAAKKESYFDNTIFVFIGDHGVAGDATAIYPAVWTDERLTDEHVPLLFYAPSLLKPQLRSEVVSQIDVLPTIAGMVHQLYVNTTLGRDLLDPAKKNNYAFITNAAGRIGMVTDEFYFTFNINGTDKQLASLNPASKIYSQQELDSVSHKLAAITSAFYETAKYMIMNNKKG